MAKNYAGKVAQKPQRGLFDAPTAKTARAKAIDSEVDAYAFIKENLKLLGWDVRNPGRQSAGQV
jgi:hypothetical protein